MRLPNLTTSRLGPKLVMILCRILPTALLHRLGRWLVSLLAKQRGMAFVQALRANIAVVLALPEDHLGVEQALTQVLYNSVLSCVDLFKAVQVGPEKVRALCDLDPGLKHAVQECLADGQGLLLVGAHMCSFDILLLGLRELVPSVQVLSTPNLTGRSQVMNQIRIKHGLEVTPISISSLREAIERLRKGGVVAIAADIPVESGEELTFFGHKAQLPVGHARMALRTGARMFVGVSHRDGAGAYRAEGALAPRPKTTGDRRQDLLCWAQETLSTLESFIRMWPDEWMMPIPVWSG